MLTRSGGTSRRSTARWVGSGRVRPALVDQALSRGSAGHGSERELRAARNMLDQGVISRADYDRMIAGL
jgi:hypothetical protein